MQMAVTAISDMNKRVRGGAAGAKEDWLDTVNKNLEQEQKVRTAAVLELCPGYLRVPPNTSVAMHPTKLQRKAQARPGASGTDAVNAWVFIVHGL